MSEIKMRNRGMREIFFEKGGMREIFPKFKLSEIYSYSYHDF
jgi:hypothetical protein